LIFGTGLSQIIFILSSPLLSRIYSPESFGVFATFFAIISILSTFTSGRYELATVLPGKNYNSNNLVLLTIFVSLFSTFLLSLLIFIFNDSLEDIFNFDISTWIFLIPLGILAVNIFNIFTYHNIRLKKYEDLSTSKIIKSASLVLIQVSIGIFDKSVFGLLVGHIFSHFIGIIKLFFNSLKNNLLEDMSLKKIKDLSYRYSNFPKYDAPSSILDIASIQLPFLLIIKIGGEIVSGNFFLASRVISIPSSLIGQSIGQVYFQELNEAKNMEGFSSTLLKNTIKKLIIIAAPFTVFIYFLSPYLFPVIFGDEWILGGEIAQYLAIVSWIQLITVPLSSTLSLNRFIRRGAFWKVFKFLILISIYIYGIFSRLDFFQFLLYLTIVQFSLYVFYLVIIIKSVYDIEKGFNK
jgi:O-antigen/teichoic acid export membrane protein